MAPESRGQKRRREAQGARQADPDASTSRRSRAVNASRPEVENQAPQPDTSASQSASKRRRLDKNARETAEESAAHAEVSRAEPTKKRRGRPSSSVTDVDKEAPAVTRKGGRPPRTSLVTAVDESPAVAGPHPKRKRGRPSLASVAVVDAQNQQGSSSNPKSTKKRGRPSLSEKHQVRPQSASKSARRSAGAAEPTTNLTNTLTAEASRKSESGATQLLKSRPRKPRHSVDGARNEESTTEVDKDPGTRHKGPFFEGEYQYITERMVTVPRSKISAKWYPFDMKAIAAVHDILLNAQRPVLYHLRNGRRRQEYAASILTAVTNRVQRKLGRGFPFPPPTISGSRTSIVAPGHAARPGHAEELDYERAVDAAQALEDQLNPTLHSVALLKAELKRQEKALEDDYRSLRTLESNARDEARSWKKSMRTTHILVPETKSILPNDDVGERWKDLELVVTQRQDDGLYQSIEDEELLKLSQQIGSHMESMQGNLRQVDGILPAMEIAKAALHEVLLKHLDPTQCDEVLLG